MVKKAKKKALTVNEAEKLIRRRVKKFLKNGGELTCSQWGDLGIDYNDNTVATDGPTCLLGASLIGLKITQRAQGDLVNGEEGAVASRLLNLKTHQVNSIVLGFDEPNHLSLSPWRRLGSKLRNEFLPLPSDE